MLHKPVIALCKLFFEHGGVFLPHVIKTVLLRRYGDTLCKVPLPGDTVYKSELQAYGAVK